jgi:hypothetical protein
MTEDRGAAYRFRVFVYFVVQIFASFAFFLTTVASAKVVAAKFFYDLDRSVLRPAVDDDILDIDALLRQDAINRRPNHRCTVEAGCYKSYFHSPIP